MIPLRKLLINIVVLLITCVLWDWGLTWGAAFFAPFLDLLDWVLSVMDRFPLSVGGGGSSSKEIIPDLNETAPPLTDEELAAESEANAAECEKLQSKICERAKELAQDAGITEPDKLEKVQDAVKYLTDCDNLDEEARIPFLNDFLANKINKAETWQEIDKEMKRWGGRGLC